MPYEVKRQRLIKMMFDWLEDTDPERYETMRQEVATHAKSTNYNPNILWGKWFNEGEREVALTHYLNNASPGTWRLLSVNRIASGDPLMVSPTDVEYETVWRAPE